MNQVIKTLEPGLKSPKHQIKSIIYSTVTLGYMFYMFKKRIMSSFLGLMLLLLAATTYQPLSDSTDVPGTQSINHVSLATSKCVM